MPDYEITVRRACEADMASIGKIVARSWQRTFSGLLPLDFLLSLKPDVQRDRHTRIFARDGVHYHIASTSGDVVGFASWGPGRDPSFSETCELYAIYLKPGFEGQGIGRRLFERVIADIASSDCRGLYLTCLAVNPHRAFFVKLGGTQIDAPGIRLGADSHEQVAFRWMDRSASNGGE